MVLTIIVTRHSSPNIRLVTVAKVGGLFILHTPILKNSLNFKIIAVPIFIQRPLLISRLYI